MHDADVERAHGAGLHCRAVQETVADTWGWLSALAAPPALRAGAMPAGLAPDREREVLRAWADGGRQVSSTQLRPSAPASS